MLSRSVADLVADVRHAAPLEGATRVGEAAGDPRVVVRVGLWLDVAGRVYRARFRATTCAALIAYAESACALAEARGAPELDGGRLRTIVLGVHPVHHPRADLVALAFARAMAGRPEPGATA